MKDGRKENADFENHTGVSDISRVTGISDMVLVLFYGCQVHDPKLQPSD